MIENSNPLLIYETRYIHHAIIQKQVLKGLECLSRSLHNALSFPLKCIPWQLDLETLMSDLLCLGTPLPYKWNQSVYINDMFPASFYMHQGVISSKMRTSSCSMYVP